MKYSNDRHEAIRKRLLPPHNRNAAGPNAGFQFIDPSRFRLEHGGLEVNRSS